ncbi:oplophorus-luciferin 2-monooxygenase non-catalytic subunit [Daphnia magna]|uniref:oplophorus-luciferin 2-monooxygenase non-catalytic subunit n=1 Tax=Daphnia magna TaxID=35525 RepID=UPI001E1BDE70|nr:oplophorus-luciferin 2-monooxygenase non-catalytic subunit [Daphnia magna]
MIRAAILHTTHFDFNMRVFNCFFQVLSLGLLLTAVVADVARKYDNNVDDVRPAKALLNNKGAHFGRGIRRIPSPKEACPEDYSPCTCQQTPSGLEISCVDIPVDQIANVFYRTQTLELYQVVLTASGSPLGTVDLPADLLKDKRVQRIYLGCPPTANPKLGLTIDSATFEFTRFTTTVFGILNCDLSTQTDMQYLNGFSVLNTLRIDDSNNIEAIATLPTTTLPSLKKLFVVNCTGLENAAFPDLTPARLLRLHLEGNGLTDAGVNNILVSVGSSSSSSSLQELVLSNEYVMTKIPRIASFSNLVWYDVSFNAIPYVSQSTLVFSSPVNYLNLKSISLGAIEGGAFLGDYGKAQVNLENNSLTEFREDVFKTMLEQMAAQRPGEGGKVIVTGNPFDCGCGLAWLIRDNPSLVSHVLNGVCGGFFKFEDLNPESYADC